MTMQIRSGCEGGGKGALIQENKSATLSTHNTQTLFAPIPIADKATRYKGGGDTRNNDGSANGMGIGEPGAPAYTLTAADRHAVGCPCYSIDDMKMQNTYIWEEQANTLAARDYKRSTSCRISNYISKSNRPAHGKFTPGKLHRTGCIQRYARSNRIHRPQAHTIGMLQTARLPR